MEGWLKIHRKIADSDLWLSEPFTRGQAWIDLLMLANHDYSFFYKRGNKVEINRGQIGRSEVELSDRWCWSRTKLRKFLNDLEKEQQIIQQKSPVTLIITLINYEKYQEKEQQTGQQKDSRKTAEKHIQECKEYKECKEEEYSSSKTDEVEFYLTKKKRKLSGKRLETFLEFWSKFNYTKGKADAADAWFEIPQLTDAICKQIFSAAEIEASRRKELLERGLTPKMAQGWLSGKRWEDEIYSQIKNNPPERKLLKRPEP